MNPFLPRAGCLAFAGLITLLAGCGGGGGTAPAGLPADAPTNFWITGSPELRIHSLGTVRAMAAQGLFPGGSIADVTDRLDWSTGNPAIARILAPHDLVAEAEGSTLLYAEDRVTGIRRTARVVVAPPLPPGALVNAAGGGYVTSGGAAAYYPPGTLDEDYPATVSEPLTEEDLVKALPEGHIFVAGVTVTAGERHAVSEPVAVELPSRVPVFAGETLSVLRWEPAAWAWIPTTWASVDERNQRVAFQLSRLGTVVVTRGDEAGALALKFAPRLVLADDDIHPISMDDFLAASRLRNASDPTEELPVGAPGPALLLAGAYDREAFSLALVDESRAAFTDAADGGDWRDVPLGGMSRLDQGGLRPVVYWAARSDGELCAIQYWFFYAATGGSPFVLDHEGGLEMFQVVLNRARQPIAATATQHGYGEGRHWREVEIVDETHPVVYVARGTHAVYFRRGFEGQGNEHPAGAGNLGLLAKSTGLPVDSAAGATVDSCAPADHEVVLAQGDVSRGYDLASLDAGPGTESAATVLLRWTGRLGREVPSDHGGETSGPRAILYKHPGHGQVGPFENMWRFHCAFNFSTRNSVSLYRHELAGYEFRDSDLLIEMARLGERLFELQAWYGGQVPDRTTLQADLDSVENLPDLLYAPTGQPSLLFWYLLQGNGASDAPASPTGVAATPAEYCSPLLGRTYDSRLVVSTAAGDPYPYLDIRVLALSGRWETQVSQDLQVISHEPAWFADGERLTWYGNVGGAADIFVARYDGTARENWTVNVGGDLVTPDPSPDGNWIAFVNVNGEALYRAPYQPGLPLAAGAMISLGTGSWPDWSPDGQAILYTSWASGTVGELYILDLAPGSRSLLRATPGWNDLWASFSPDGRRVAFQSNMDGDYDIWVAEVDDFHRFIPGSARRVSMEFGPGATEINPCWSPDGQEVAFLSNRSGNWRPWVVGADGKNLRMIPTDEDVWEIDWSSARLPEPGSVRVTGGTVSDVPISAADPEILATRGQRLQGQIDVRANNIVPGSSSVHLAWTPTWGTPRDSFRSLSSGLPIGISDTRVDIDILAPTDPGTYYLVFAMAGSESAAQLMSGTLPPADADWADGNPVALLPAKVVERSMRFGYVPFDWFSPDDPMAGSIGMAAVRVVVE